ncbi:MAG TPA: beta-glucosidase [Micrococcales bacterium]|uniref:GH1 family beta-glucosidase n=1 Tax=Miniimonas arenae TaxID=676201 RepID=UPI000ECB12B6|nr:GH1 family beta-glucosidase [Miniimonas arenae]HCX84514.1 beta-glucosidase [Micrococcales bacterium]
MSELLRPSSPWPAPQARRREFPADFTFGVATSAYQIEGAAHVGGRTDSIWDTFARRPGTIDDASTGEVAVDHYHRFGEDVALMRQLGVGGYRFSTSWARVRPDGGAPNPEGLDFYSRLVDAQLEAGITPWVTLYHWDLPQALEDAGGWRSRDIVPRFVEYALTMHEALGDRVRHWLTLNEPWCTAFLGYAGGQHAPGVQDDVGALRALHHLLLAHGEAVRALRAADPAVAGPDAAPLTLGIAPNFSLYSPLDPASAADVDTARRLRDAQWGCFVEPLLRGAYPETFLADVADLWPEDLVRDGDLDVIATPIDVLGVNYYNSWVIAAPDGSGTVAPSGASDDAGTSPWVTARESRWVPTQAPRTAMDWENHPGAFRDLLLELQALAGPRGTHLIVTENGCAYDDDVLVDGVVQDPERITYLREHLTGLHEAIERGADVRAYLLWTFLDNFEWAYGYTKAFGLVHVDRETLARTPKASAHWYAALARTRVLEG